MKEFIDPVLVVVLLLNFVSLGASRLRTLIARLCTAGQCQLAVGETCRFNVDAGQRLVHVDAGAAGQKERAHQHREALAVQGEPGRCHRWAPPW